LKIIFGPYHVTRLPAHTDWPVRPCFVFRYCLHSCIHKFLWLLCIICCLTLLSVYALLCVITSHFIFVCNVRWRTELICQLLYSIFINHIRFVADYPCLGVCWNNTKRSIRCNTWVEWDLNYSMGEWSYIISFCCIMLLCLTHLFVLCRPLVHLNFWMQSK
jgi:hypothetical protein